MKNIFFKNHAENEARRLAPDTFCFFKKALHEGKAIDLQLSFNTLRQSTTWHTMRMADIMKNFFFQNQGTFFDLKKGRGCIPSSIR